MTYRTTEQIQRAFPLALRSSAQFEKFAAIIIQQNTGSLEFDDFPSIQNRFFDRVDRAVELKSFGYEDEQWGQELKADFNNLPSNRTFSQLRLNDDVTKVLALLFSSFAADDDSALENHQLEDAFFIFIASAAREKGKFAGQINSSTAVKAMIPFWTVIFPFCRRREVHQPEALD